MNWILEIQAMELTLDNIIIYPIPNTTPNSIWGCFAVIVKLHAIEKIGKNTYCQVIKNRIYIPENSILFPTLSDNDLERLFPTNPFIFHPEFGLFELADPVNWIDLINIPESLPSKVKTPIEGTFIPKSINSFQVSKISTDDVIENMEKNIFPKREKMENKPLSIPEKIKLYTLRAFIAKRKEGTNTTSDPNSDIKNSSPSKIAEFFHKIFSQNKLIDKLTTDLEELERRNQKEVDRLLELFRKNPELALKFAIPLDETGTNRGGNLNRIQLKNWSDFSLFGRSTNGSGSGIISGNHYSQLSNQYYNTAVELIKKNEHHKAAFIYMKLLKNYYQAAQTLESGEYYQEAAALYINYVKNNSKAAECYEKGKMIIQAIEIYKELNQDEKVGDLYSSIYRNEEAVKYYNKVVDNYRSSSQYVKASLIYRNKIKDTTKAQDLLFEGWKNDKDAYNCLNNYFTNFEEKKHLENEIETVYNKEVTPEKKGIFLQVIRHEHEKSPEIKNLTRNIAYEIISDLVRENPQIISELRFFNKEDNMLVRDIMKFKKK